VCIAVEIQTPPAARIAARSSLARGLN
ncbi:hypothetical protein GCK32_018989, partial [Trichostrongylus colubriformis]